MRSAIPILLALTLLSGCASTYPRTDPTGQPFPTVAGEDLNGNAVGIPADYAGEPVLLLVGYKQSTQFDIDRWLLGLYDAKISVRAVEVPTIPGMLPGLYASQINRGMRAGIPDNLYGIVVTLYRDDAKTVAEFTGNANGLPARVLLLDRAGRVVYFHDAGYSIDALMAMKAALGRIGN